MQDGDAVRYVGFSPDYVVGEEGMVLASSGEGCHVQWASTGEVSLVVTEDLQKVLSPVEASREASLGLPDEEQSLESLQVAEERRLSYVTALSDDVREYVHNRILNDPILCQAAGEIGEDAMVAMILSEAGDG